MIISARPTAQPGTSLKSLINGFILTKQTEGKSPRTIEFYSENLKRFLWYASQKKWSDDIRNLTEWDIRDFLGYLANETNRWGITGNGSEPARRKVTHTTIHHYFVVLANFFGWVLREGYLANNSAAKIKVAKPKNKVIEPYTGFPKTFYFLNRSNALGQRKQSIISGERVSTAKQGVMFICSCFWG